MKKIAVSIALVALALAAYLALWPVPVQPVGWRAPVAHGLYRRARGQHLLAGLRPSRWAARRVRSTSCSARDGKLYAAVASGNILRMNPDGTSQELFANTGGRVLGFDFDAAGNLIAADAVKGLLAVGPDRKITLLTDNVGGDPIRYADAVVVAPNGKIYFSDASAASRRPPGAAPSRLRCSTSSSSQRTGRILEYDPATKAHARRRQRPELRQRRRAQPRRADPVRRRDRQVPRLEDRRQRRPISTSLQGSPLASVLFDNLPGYPDNLMRGLDGRIWVGFSGPRNPNVDAMADKPFLRQLTLRLPRALWPLPKPYGHVMAFTEDGKVMADLQDPTGAYPQTTGVTETADRLYVQNLHLGVLGWRALTTH